MQDKLKLIHVKDPGCPDTNEEIQHLILAKIHSEVPEKKLKVQEGRRTAHDDGRHPIAIGHLCGTDDVNNFIQRSLELASQYIFSPF